MEISSLVTRAVYLGDIDEDLDKQPDKAIMALGLRGLVGGDLFLDPVGDAPEETDKEQVLRPDLRKEGRPEN